LAFGEAQRKAGEFFQAYEYATALLAHGKAGAREKAVALLNEVLALSCMLGMHSLKERITAQMAMLDTHSQAVQAYPSNLSPREVEMLRLIALGKSNRDIADELCVSLSTVATHVRNILGKTDSATRPEAAAYALRQSLLEE